MLHNAPSLDLSSIIDDKLSSISIQPCHFFNKKSIICLLDLFVLSKYTKLVYKFYFISRIQLQTNICVWIVCGKRYKKINNGVLSPMFI